jgi:type IX secretion system PorP/SprF family membrane protein
MRLIICFLICFISVSSKAQSRQYYNQYMLNPGFFNPANMDIYTKYGGTMQYSNDFAGQGISPTSMALYGHYNRRGLQGFGGTIINDYFGGYNQLEVAANYAYKKWAPLGNICYSFGVRVGMMQQSLNTTELYYPSKVKDGVLDPVLMEPKLAKIGLNMGFGFAMVTKDFDLNFSMPGLIANRMPSNGDSTRTSLFEFSNNNFFLSAGYKIRMDDSWYVFYPTFMLKGAFGAPVHAGLDLNYLMNQMVYASIGARSDLSLVANIGIFLDAGWRFIYTYQNHLLTQHPGSGYSHEISIGYARTLPESPFKFRKFMTASGEFKKPTIKERVTRWLNK